MVDNIPMVGERLLFKMLAEDGDTAQRARALFPNQGFHRPALAIAAAHDRAIQYLEQAPVIVFAMAPDARSYKQNVLFARWKLEALCEAGAPLKAVMATLGMPYVLRRLSGAAFYPKHRGVIDALKPLDAVMLGRTVPAAALQRRWLDAIGEWHGLGRYGRSARAQGLFVWAVQRLSESETKARDVRHVLDFVDAADEVFNEAWRWPRAVEEAHLWHTRINTRRAIYGLPITPETVVDLGAHPDEAANDGFTFLALRTPEQIAEEGSAMRHCVATYVKRVVDGQSHIISIRLGEHRVATLELNGNWQRLQCKGKANAQPKGAVLTAADHYAFAIRKALKHTSTLAGRAA